MPYRWIVALLLCLASILNYVDRQALSILASTIQRDLAISDSGYAAVVQTFLFTYTVMYLLSGRIVDRLGTRVAETAFILWWAVSNLSTSLVTGVVSLAAVRGSLGIGEPGNFTAAAKAVAEWFPPREKGIAVGMYSMGGTVGAAIAAPLVSFLALRFGWRSAFVVTGSIGISLAAVWYALYRTPAGPVEAARPLPWREYFADPALGLILLARMITDPLWFFYLFWFPKYLQDARAFTLADLGRTLWVVFVAADAGCLLGGWLSGRWIRRGTAPVTARLRVMTGAALVLAGSFVVPVLPGGALPLAAASVFAFAHMAWLTNSTTLPIDLFPTAKVGSVQGAVGAGSSLGGFLSAGIIGMVVTRASYTPLFFAMSLLHPAAIALLWSRLPRERETGA